jgi:hypothetical protein
MPFDLGVNGSADKPFLLEVTICDVYVSGGFNETWLNVTVNKIPASS